MDLKLTNKEIRKYLNISSPEFPKYMAPIINLANRFAQGTRPKTVGQLSELIREVAGKSLSEWEEWYVGKNPDTIINATEKIIKMIDNFKEAMNKIDRDLIEQWVKDLVIVKTFIGLRFHEAILKKVAELKGCKCRLAKPEEESKGIDGYIDSEPISIKPVTYRDKPELLENIEAKFIFYEKVRDGIKISFDEI